MIGIIGGGVWGSALAKLLSTQKVVIHARDKKIVDSINEHHFNPRLKYAVFNENVTATNSLEEISEKEYIFIALPSQKIRSVLENPYFKKNSSNYIIASKGIEIKNSLFLSDLIKELTNYKSINILSGPCFSDEVSQDLPTAVTFASTNQKTYQAISSWVKDKNFRMYYSEDIIGAQIGGALKNIYAIAAGITEGLNLGENARSALVTRSIVELVRFANFFRANQETIFGLSGLGDLILTCNSLKSRNTNFGKKIANTKFENYEDILNTQQITEGYFTVKAVNSIAEENKINMPIMKSVYNILYKNHDIKNEIKELMNRPLIEEKI
tara:strand:- start:1526 stop:2503 length:978 start_codon:yes stop_codon:yes gene_type:complete